MIRVVGMAFGFAVLVAIATNGNQAAITIAFLVALAAILVPLVTGRTALRCPACRKRVKIGATACSHCGREVARTG